MCSRSHPAGHDLAPASRGDEALNATAPGSREAGLGAVGLKKIGGVVLSHRVAPAVPSAQRGLTSEFGMGSGGSPALWPPISKRVKSEG